MLFDIGANCGNYTMANIEKYDKIICVDASALQCELLDKRIPKDKCTIVHSLVTSDPNAQFYRCIGDSGISSANMEWINGKGRFSPGKTDWWPGLQWTPENPPKTSMDQLISIHGTPSFIKIDVEGHEKEVIKSLSAYSGPLAFEWAEELKYETIEIINYIHEVLGHSLFYIQQMDEYTFVPNQNEYISTEEILKLINETWNIERHRLWGMIWCR
jgi:FkbM family methyltransferase